MKKTDTINFNGLYYTKSTIFANEIKKGVKPHLIDYCPSRVLKNIIEESPIFNDLKNKTDVYISSFIDLKNETPLEYTRNVRAIFKDPYRKDPNSVIGTKDYGTTIYEKLINIANRIDRIDISVIGKNETIIFEKLRKILTTLPLYKDFKDKQFNPLRMFYLGKDGSDGFIQRAVKY